MPWSARYGRALAYVLAHEGGFVAHPADPGGATNRGISLRYARSRGLIFDLDGDGDVDPDDIRRIGPEHVAPAFHADFWRPVRGDELPAGLALLLFDCAVHAGAPRTIRLLQRAARVREDGAFGPATLAAALRPGVAERFQAARARFLAGLPGWRDFAEGWTVRLATLPFQAAELDRAEA